MPTELIQSIRIDAAELPDESLIFGATEAMREVQSRIERIVHTDFPVLIRGESGTGKEVVARFLHARSDRRSLPFVKVSCGAVSAALLAGESKPCDSCGPAPEAGRSLVDLADGGTLFFDEIADLDWSLQAKLLNLLEDGPLARSAGRAPRVVCATNRNLEKAVERHAFRRDLFYRIDVIGLHLKPLRERREDIPLLCEHFLDKLSRRFERTAPALTPFDVKMLTRWSWPGNLRELENRIARTIVFGQSQVLNEESDPLAELAEPERLSAALSGSGDGLPENPHRDGWARTTRGGLRNVYLHADFRRMVFKRSERRLRRRRPNARQNRWENDPPQQI